MTRSENSSSRQCLSRDAKSETVTPRLALIGCGAIAEEYYLPALARQSDILRHLTLVDPNEARAGRLAERFSAKSCTTDYKRISSCVDGVIIAAPTHLHRPIALEFLSSGIHVLCEKPLADSAESAREMVGQAERCGVVLAANYLQRVIPSFACVKKHLDHGTFGPPLHIDYRVGELFTWPTVSGFYFNSPLSARGVLRDRGAHVMDHICWWLGGKPDLVSSFNDSFGGSEAVAHVRFMRGSCTGDVRLCWLAGSKSTFSVVCKEGRMEGDVYDYRRIRLTERDGKTRTVLLTGENVRKTDIADKILGNFIAVVQKREQPLVAGNDVLDSIEFIDECYATAGRLRMPWYDAIEG